MPDLETRPKQRIVCQLFELLGDEWLLVAAYHWRWAYSTAGTKGQFMFNGERALGNKGKERPYLEPTHRDYNEWQWGRFLMSNETAKQQKAAGNLLFDSLMLRMGPKKGCQDLGITSDELAEAWEQSTLRFLSLFETHLADTGHPFVLGRKPSLADYGLLGPLYAHLYEDPVPGFIMRTRFPMVAEWCERVHNRGGEIRSEMSMSYDKAASTLVDDDAKMVNEWPENDEVPTTVVNMLNVFFVEMWPVLVSSCTKLTAFTGGVMDTPVPGKSFSAAHPAQFPGGQLTHEFEIPVYDTMGTAGNGTVYGGPLKFLKGRRMVIPYQIWMLGRVADEVASIKQNSRARDDVAAFLKKCGDPQDHKSFMNVDEIVQPCRLKKVGGKLFTAASSPTAKL